MRRGRSVPSRYKHSGSHENLSSSGSEGGEGRGIKEEGRMTVGMLKVRKNYWIKQRG